MIGDVQLTVPNTPAGRAEADREAARRGLVVDRIDYPDPSTAVYHCRPRGGHRPTLTTPLTPPLQTGLHGEGI